MEVTFIEQYDKLEDLKPGQVATSKNRQSFFACGWHYDKILKKNVAVTLDLNNLFNQYTDDRDTKQPVKILTGGDKFVCSA